MTGEDIITHFEWLVDDDTVDDTQKLTLLNQAYDFICALDFWEFLAAADTSLTILAGDSTYALPSDFLMTRKVTLRQSATSDTFVECTPVTYEDRLKYLGDQTKYYIDYKNSQIVFCEDPSQSHLGWQLIHDYQYQPAQLATGTTPVFPRAFQLLPAYEMAKMYYFNDQGEKNRSWNAEMAQEYNRIFNGLRRWDNNLKMVSRPSGNPYNYAPQLN